MVLRKKSLKTKLILFVGVVVLIISSTLGFLSWKFLIQQVRQTSRQKLMSIAATTATLITASQHEKIQTGPDQDSIAYNEIHSLLNKIKQANPGVSDIYTMRRSAQENQWIFVVSALYTNDHNHDGQLGQDEQGAPLGEIFDVTAYSEMQKAFEIVTADYVTSCDKWGCWLSGYAPIFDSNGQAVAIVGVDMAADDLKAFEQQSRKVILSVLATVLFLFPLLLYFYLRKKIQPVSQIVNGIKAFNNNLSKRIKVNSGDEFEVIARTFNTMAAKLQKVEAGLEAQVKKKTKELSQKVKEIERAKVKDEALLASIGEGLIAINPQREIIMVNPQAQRMLGLNSSKILGKKLGQVVRLQDNFGLEIKGGHSPLEMSLMEKIELKNFYHLVSQTGAQIPVKIIGSPVKLRQKVIGAIIVLIDITEEKRIDTAKTEFISLASHQLRTPLSSINWYLELMADPATGKLNASQKQCLHRLLRSNQRMVKLVQALLNVSRIDMGTFFIENKLVDLAGLMKISLKEFDSLISRKKLKITTNFDERLPKIMADPQLVQIIFQNLISNAIKYTPAKGKIAVKICRLANHGIQVKISDSGYGIPKNQQAKVFSKLFRADNIKDREQEGNGLGLYTVKSILDASGGKIDFSSRENRGTNFVVTFPLSGMKEKKGTKTLN